MGKRKVKVSYSLVVAGDGQISGGSLYLRHSIRKVEPIPLPLLHYPSLFQKRYPFIAGLTEFSSHELTQGRIQTHNLLHHS